MANSPSKEDRERLLAAIQGFSRYPLNDEAYSLLGFPTGGTGARQGRPTRYALIEVCTEILYNAIVSAHDRIDELEEGDAVAERVVPDWVSARGLVIKDEAHSNKPPIPELEDAISAVFANNTIVVTRNEIGRLSLRIGKFVSPTQYERVYYAIKFSGEWELAWGVKDGSYEHWVRRELATVEVEVDTLDAESLDMMRKMHDFGFYYGFEMKDVARVQTLRRLGYIRHCYSITNNFYFWILTEKGYAYLRVFDAIP